MKDNKKVINELKQERGVLEEKRNKLENFMLSNYKNIENFKFFAIQKQLSAMNQYIEALTERINYLINEINYNY